VSRRIFIGDIQGCLEELERLLALLKFDTARDALEPVGDLVNRGPDSLGVLRLLKSMNAGGVLGNHDLHLLATSRGARKQRRGDTLSEILEAHDREDLLVWLRAKPFVKTWPGLILVHAGLHPTWTDPLAAFAGLETEALHPNIEFATRVRWCTPEGIRPDPDDDPPKVSGYRPWHEHRPCLGETIVFGHWARPGLVKTSNLRGLDTGCVWGGRLTAWIAGEDQFVSVAAARAYSATS
jgi:bis(5'-nucleosyl)-tetraphosphatase (symmetrical)